MEKKRWKSVAVSVGTVLALGLLVFLVFRDHMAEIAENLKGIPTWGVVLLLCLAMLYQALDGAICSVLVGDQCPGFTYAQAVEVVFMGVFGNVAPLYAGAISLQSWALHRRGMDVGSSVGTMLLQFSFHKTSILIYTTLLLLPQLGWLRGGNSSLVGYTVLGYVVGGLIVAALLLLCTWDKVRRLVLWLMSRLPHTEKWQKRKDSWSGQIEALYQQSRRVVADRGCVIQALALNICKLFTLYTVTYVCLRLLGVITLSFWQVQLLAALTHLIANAIPNLAGIGPTEFAFLLAFSPYMAYATASSALILYRGATYFFPFLVSVFVFLFAQRQVQKKYFDENCVCPARK